MAAEEDLRLGNYGEYRELKRWVKVTQETHWTWRNRTSKSTNKIVVRMVARKPKDPKWNDYYFPVTIKVPMFYEHSTTLEAEVPPLSAGRVALEMLKDQG